MIIIPMAGNSSRFFDEGYLKPKYELLVGDQTVFSLTLKSFEKYFETDLFLFIGRKSFDSRGFVFKECEKNNVKNFIYVELDSPSRGQAETVYLGLQMLGEYDKEESLIIFNIDTIRNNYTFPLDCMNADGYIEVFDGAGDAWSFVEPKDGNSVKRTTEKLRVSNLCSTGLYHFSRISHFIDGYEYAVKNIDSFLAAWRELYVAPIYNFLIDNHDLNIMYHQIRGEDVIFTGTPSEYIKLCEMVK
jgi:hypothetical protein